MSTNKLKVAVEVIDDLVQLNTEVLLKKGFYKITFSKDSYIIIRLKEDTWSTEVEKFIETNYGEYEVINFKEVNYILDYKEKEE